jgi:O-antigen/teichoic acid export membrane protein
MPLYLGTLMRVVTLQAGLIIIGSFLPNDQIGIYGVILRLAELVMFGVGLVDAIAAPMIAELFHAGRMVELQRLVTFATRITFAMAMLVSLMLYVGGHWILGFYGADFQAGYRAMGIVMFANILQGLVGPVGYMMSMTDQQKKLVLIQGVSMLLNLGLSFALIPIMGIEGAAIALAVSTTVWQGWMFVYVKRRFGIRSTIF